jgi:hypothetical protein
MNINSLARIRILHEVAKGPPVEIYIDGINIMTQDPLLFEEISDYMQIPSGVHTVQVKVFPSSDESPALITQNVDLQASNSQEISRYTIVAHGDVNNLQKLGILLLQDEGKCTYPSSARVRFVHAAATVPAVDVYLDGSKSLSHRAYGSVSPYLKIPSGVHSIKVKVAGTNQAVLMGKLDFAPGSSYSIYASGLVGDSQAPVKVLMFTDGSGWCYVL